MKSNIPAKPLGRSSFGSIPHLLGSRLGPGEHTINAGQTRICLEKPRDKHDRIICTVKHDGSCCSVANWEGNILPLQRSGYLASSSPYEQHQLFAFWVREREEMFRAVLKDGERLVGEWLAYAHGTRYRFNDDSIWQPFMPFDLMVADRHLPYDQFRAIELRCDEIIGPEMIMDGPPCSIAYAMETLKAIESAGGGQFSALDPLEGAVWRVERKGEFDFFCKFVKPDKVDGCFFPQNNGGVEVWNWRPKKS